MLRKDERRELKAVVFERVCDGEAIRGHIFKRQKDYLFVGEYNGRPAKNYWFQ